MKLIALNERGLANLSLHGVGGRCCSRFEFFLNSLIVGNLDASMRGFDVNEAPSAEEGATASSSPNSTVSSFHLEFSAPQGSAERGEAAAAERASSRVSDEEGNGLCRKKLRLSKEQSAFLEESFKEHNTLNPVSHQT